MTTAKTPSSYKTTPEQRARAAAYRKNNPEKVSAVKSKWHREHRAELQASRAAKYAADPESARRRAREYYYANRDARLAYHAQRRAKLGTAFNTTRRDALYNLAPGEYDAMLASQGFGCAICGGSFAAPGNKGLSPVVDHCHATGKVRGILHNNCNRGIGLLGDNLVTIENAARYLRTRG